MDKDLIYNAANKLQALYEKALVLCRESKLNPEYSKHYSLIGHTENELSYYYLPAVLTGVTEEDVKRNLFILTGHLHRLRAVIKVSKYFFKKVDDLERQLNNN